MAEETPDRVEGEITVNANGDVVIGAPTAEALIVLPKEGDDLSQ